MVGVRTSIFLIRCWPNYGIMVANLKMKEAKAGEKVNPLFHVDNFEIDSSSAQTLYAAATG